MITFRRSGGILAACGLFLAVGCSQQRPSERDINRQLAISRSEVKRAELNEVAGRYAGTLRSGDTYEQSVILVLQVRDVPEENPTEGMDPVTVPKLVGYLRFLYGNEDNGEYSDAPVRDAEYYAGRKLLNVVVTHSQFQDLILNLTAQPRAATGTWSAAAVGVSGTAQFTLESGN